MHVVEIDERLGEALRDATDPHANVTLHWADAMTLDLGGLRPAPDKVVANLPYGVAASVLLRTIEELPSVHMWVAMVQREVGERLAAGPVGGAAPGGRRGQAAGRTRPPTGCPRCLPSWRVRCRCCARFRAPCSIRCRTSTRCSSACAGAPAPTGAGAGEEVSPALRALVAGAFAHRRKTLAGSLALAAGEAGAQSRQLALPHRSREQLREALREPRPSAGRARGAPVAGGLPRARAPAGAMSARDVLAPGVHRALAPAKVNLGLFVGPVRASDGRHELRERDAVDLARG